MAVEKISARAVVDLFSLLPQADQHIFFRLLGQQLTSENALRITSEMSLTEREKYMKMYLSPMMTTIFPILADTAAKIAHTSPNALDGELGHAIHQEVMTTFDEYGSTIAKVEVEKAKTKRDRKSDPETVKRNIELCDLRNQNRKKWSLAKLAGKYDMTKRAVSKIHADEAKWRRLAKGVD